VGQLELTSREEEKNTFRLQNNSQANSLFWTRRSSLWNYKRHLRRKKSQSLLKRLADRIGRHSRSDDMNCKRRCCCGSSSFSLFHQSKKHINISISFGQKELHARDNTTRHKGKGRRIGIKRVSQRKEICFITEKN